MEGNNQPPEADLGRSESSSLGAASQLKSLKAARVAKADGDQGSESGSGSASAERIVHKRIDLRNEQWQKPKASGIVAVVVTAFVCIAILVVVSLCTGTLRG